MHCDNGDDEIHGYNGDDCVVVPAVKTEDIPAIFPKGHTEVKPYLRMTPQPNLN